MPKPKGSKRKRCRMQRALFVDDPIYARKWVAQYGEQCKGVPMTRNSKPLEKT
jgi:hypothetical protein